MFIEQYYFYNKKKLLLEQIKNYFGVGNITKHYKNKVLNYRISATKDLAKIIDHLDRYPLVTQKLADYELFIQAYNLVINKQHLIISGLQEIVALKASMNLGLSDNLKIAFPDVIPKTRSLIRNKIIVDPQWLAGFAAAEGCFFVNIHKSSTIKIKVNVQLEFNITQHSRDDLLIKSLMEYLNCGKVYKNNNVSSYRVIRFSDLSQKIIPFFKKYPLVGIKSKDFEDFCIVADIMKEKKHLTLEGIEQIREVKARMNTGRDKSF